MTSREPESVLIVGSGIIGIACAHYLQQQGMQVTVIDKGTIAGECSHANCGYICPSHVPPLTEPGAFGIALKSLFNKRSPFRVKPTLNPATLRWMMQFAIRCNHQQVLSAGKHLQSILDASLAEYKQLMQTEQLNCQWQEKGLLYVFRSADALEKFAEHDRMLTEHFGVSAKRIEGRDLPDFDAGLREGLSGAYYYPGDASVRPDQLNRSWSESLKRKGVRFIEKCSLQDTQVESGRITGLKTSHGLITADRYVFAMGAISGQWSKRLGVKLPVLPGKGYSVTMARPEFAPEYPMLFPEHKVGVSPFDDGFRLGSMMEFVGYDTSIPAHRIQQLRDSARDYLKASVDGPALETWYGWRPMTWDSLPIIGAIPSFANGYLATGHNMLGLSLAPATGRLLAEIIKGLPPHIDPAAYTPERF